MLFLFHPKLLGKIKSKNKITKVNYRFIEEYQKKIKLTTTQTLITELLTAAAIYLIALYILKALKKQDFELLKQAFPKLLTKYINIIERITVR